MDAIERELRLRARELLAVRPDVRLYQAHPAIRLQATSEHAPRRLSERRLGLRWSWRSCSPDEREEIAEGFFRWLLERLAIEHDLAFEVWTHAGDDPLLDAIAPHAAFVDREVPGAQGQLTQEAIERLVEGRLGEALVVEREGLLRFVALGGWKRAGAWLTAEEAETILSELRAEPLSPDWITGRPGERLHQVHPAIGVREAEDDHLVTLDEAALGMGWLALPQEEQRQRERDLLGELLAYARERGAAIASEPEAVDALMTPDDDEKLPWITADDHVVIESWEPRRTGVWVAPYDAPTLQRRLTDAWWEPWQRRRDAVGTALKRTRDGGRVSRETRARIVLWWPRVGGLLLAACAFVAERTIEFSWAYAIPAVIAVVAFLWGIEVVLKRWYERS